MTGGACPFGGPVLVDRLVASDRGAHQCSFLQGWRALIESPRGARPEKAAEELSLVDAGMG
jgi:hypothetical protein